MTARSSPYAQSGQDFAPIRSRFPEFWEGMGFHFRHAQHTRYSRHQKSIPHLIAQYLPLVLDPDHAEVLQ